MLMLLGVIGSIFLIILLIRYLLSLVFNMIHKDIMKQIRRDREDKRGRRQ